MFDKEQVKKAVLAYLSGSDEPEVKRVEVVVKHHWGLLRVAMQGLGLALMTCCVINLLPAGFNVIPNILPMGGTPSLLVAYWQSVLYHPMFQVGALLFVLGWFA